MRGSAHRGNLTAKARRLLEQPLDVPSLHVDRCLPARRTERGLDLPLQEMHQEHRDPASKLAPLAFPQALDLLGEVRPVRVGVVAGAQKRRLLLCPQKEIVVVAGTIDRLPDRCARVHGRVLPAREI